MIALWWSIRLTVKDLVCAIGLGDRLVEYCERCGRRQPLYWRADNTTWAEVTGYQTPEGDNAPGVLCPECFDTLAQRCPGITTLRWVPQVEITPTPTHIRPLQHSRR